MIPGLSDADALILVDVQNDFCPGGALPVSQGDDVVPILNRWIEEAAHAGAVIAATRDWHPRDHVSFEARGGPWPEHCVQGTRGAEIHPGLELPAQTLIINKGSDPDCDAYSGFEGTGLADVLRARGVRRLWVGGLALDYCVKATVLDARREGFETHLIESATRAVAAKPGDEDRALEEILLAGAVIERSRA